MYMYEYVYVYMYYIHIYTCTCICIYKYLGLSYAVGGPLDLDAQQAALQDGESEYESENVLLSELIDEHGGDLNPDENLLEGMCK
jgi:hypothetical protein